jgi:hypothetical protein
LGRRSTSSNSAVVSCDTKRRPRAAAASKA